MKSLIFLATLIGVLGLATGCKPSNRVTFKPALISVDPGEGWKPVNMYAEAPACKPTLISKFGMINALLLEDSTDIKHTAHQMQNLFTANTNAVVNSFKQEDFTTDSGLTGVHLSYTTYSPKSGKADARSHNFVTHNMVGKCVSISYVTSSDVESPAVLEAIRKTLRVE